MHGSRSRSSLWLLAGLLCCVIAAKLLLISVYGTDQPYLDQWAGEGLHPLYQVRHGHVPWDHFFSPHSEHRPALMRYASYACYVMNGFQWDPYVELVFNLIIYAATVVIVWCVITVVITDECVRAAMALLTALLFSLPSNFENTLWGFQSQFMFLPLCGFLHLWGTLRNETLNWRWGVAQLAGVAGIFSIAAGFMSAVALFLIMVIFLWQHPRSSWAWATLGVNLAIIGLALGLMPEVPRVENMPYNSQRLASVGVMLSWPYASYWMWLILCLPAVIVGWQGWWRTSAKMAAVRYLLPAMGLWVLLMILVLAYGRAPVPGGIAVRYFDVLVFALLTNGLCCGLIWCRCRSLARVLVGCWLLVVLIGLMQANSPADMLKTLRGQRSLAWREAEAVREFLQTDDPLVLEQDPAIRGRFPHWDLTLMILRDPGMREVLPPGLQIDGRRGPLSRIVPVITSGWWLLLGMSFASFGAGISRAWANRSCSGWQV